MRDREKHERKRQNRGVHSCHGCMIITDSSVIEDLLTAFHYQQQTYNETGRGGRGGGEEAVIGMRSGGGGDRCWGRLPQDGRVSKGIRQGREKRRRRRLSVTVKE